jgi:hypothetical protein
VPFKIPRAILALPIWLIDRLRIDERTSRARPLVVRIDIVHRQEETRVRDVRGQRGIEPMFRRHAVKPNRGVTRTDLAMDGLTFRVSMHATPTEAEGIDEEIVSRRDVLASQNRNDSLEIRHDVLLLSHVRPQNSTLSFKGFKSRSAPLDRLHPVRYPFLAMAASDSGLMALVRAIVVGDAAAALRLLAASPVLVSARAEDGATRQAAKAYYLDEIGHYLYAGDTALHIAAAAYRLEIVRTLIAMGGDVRARNRRGAEPLHYAADGAPGSRTWNPSAQAATVACLIEAGADPNTVDQSGVTPLHRAVRTRCAAAVSALLDGGADVRRKNKTGSTPMRLATLNTGRGGSGSPESKAQQEEITRLLEQHGATQ